MNKTELNNLSSLPFMTLDQLPQMAQDNKPAMGNLNGIQYISVVDERNRRGRPPKTNPGKPSEEANEVESNVAMVAEGVTGQENLSAA